MKKIFMGAALLILVNFTASACPNLSGNFVEINNSNNTLSNFQTGCEALTSVVSYIDENGEKVTEKVDIFIDGIERPDQVSIEEDGQGRKYTLRSFVTCSWSEDTLSIITRVAIDELPSYHEVFNGQVFINRDGILEYVSDTDHGQEINYFKRL